MKATYRVLVPVLLGGLLLLGGVGHRGDAHAHSVLESSEPADGATLEDSPGVVTLRFTEEPDPSLARVQLVDQTRRLIPDTETASVPKDSRAIQLEISELPEDTYTVI